MTLPNQPVTQLIVNADDFGFSPGITDGILRAHHHGILTSTTLMTTMPDRDRAIELGKGTPSLGVGIHLSLTQGTPFTRGPKLFRGMSTFPPTIPKLAHRLWRRGAVQDVAAEWSAQIEYALTRGLKVTHLDSHKHVYHMPMLHETVLSTAKQYGIRYIRAAREVHLPGSTRGSIGYRIVARLARRLARQAQTADILTSDWFYGLVLTGRMDTAAWIKFLGQAPTGMGEVMVHPGYTTDLQPSQTRLITQRTTELDALIDPKVREALDHFKIQLTHYGKVAES